MASSAATDDSLATDRDWSDIPWFRKPFGLVVLFLVFIPGYLAMIWTGDIYRRKNGIVYRTSLARKKTMTVVAVLLMVSFLARSFH